MTRTAEGWVAEPSLNQVATPTKATLPSLPQTFSFEIILGHKFLPTIFSIPCSVFWLWAVPIFHAYVHLLILQRIPVPPSRLCILFQKAEPQRLVSIITCTHVNLVKNLGLSLSLAAFS